MSEPRKPRKPGRKAAKQTTPQRRPVRFRATPSNVSPSTWIPAQAYVVLVVDAPLFNCGEEVPILIDHEMHVVMVNAEVSAADLHASLSLATGKRFGLITPPGGIMPTHAIAVSVESLTAPPTAASTSR